MKRWFSVFFIYSVLAAVFCVSCKTPPSVTAPARIEKFGAGSVEETPVASNKAEAPAAIQKIRTEEILAQVAMHEADLKQQLEGRKYANAIKSFESLSGLLNGVPAGLIRLKDDRALIESALDSIRLEAVSIPAETVAGTAFKKDFSVLAYALVNGEKRPISGFEFAVSSPSGTETRTTSEDGIIAFKAPVPEKAGRNALVMSSTLTSNESSLQDSLNLRREKGLLSLSFPHVVFSNAKRYPTTISILDYNQSGKPVLSSNFSATTLLKPLVQKGFSPIGMSDFPSQLAAGDEEALLKAAKAMFGSGVRRFIYGTVKLADVAQNDAGLWTCTAAANITVHDFTLNAPVCRVTDSVTATGKTESAAITAARTKLAADTLVQDLCYSM